MTIQKKKFILYDVRIIYLSDPRKNIRQREVKSAPWQICALKHCSAYRDASHLVSSRNPSFSVKVGPVAREGSLVYHRGLRADVVRVDSNISTGKSPMNERTPSSSSPPRESVTEEKCRLFFVYCDKRARRRTNISTYPTHERKRLHFLINERSCFSVVGTHIKSFQIRRLSEIIINSVLFKYNNQK